MSPTEKQSIIALQQKLNGLRKELGASAPGTLLYWTDISAVDEEMTIVEADGSGGSVLMQITGRYPFDYTTTRTQHFDTEDEGQKAAELLEEPSFS
jgi:hypothetical protein